MIVTLTLSLHSINTEKADTAGGGMHRRTYTQMEQNDHLGGSYMVPDSGDVPEGECWLAG